MQNFFDRLGDVIKVDNPQIVALLTALLTPVASFFHVEMFLALSGFLALDFLTGFWKAKKLNRLKSARFGDAVDRAVYYAIVYVVLHVMTLVLPVGPFSSLPETLVLTGYLVKEALSILENLKAIRMANGDTSPLIDALIAKLGMDMDRIVDEISNAGAGLNSKPTPKAAPVADNQETP